MDHDSIRCGVTSRTGAPAGHTHVCTDDPHPALGPDRVGRPHTCECGTKWSGEVELDGGRKVGEFFRMPSDALESIAPSGRRLHDGPAAPLPERRKLELATGGPITRPRKTYLVEEIDGTHEVPDVTDIVYAPSHVVFVRDGELVLARRADSIWRITPKDEP